MSRNNGTRHETAFTTSIDPKVPPAIATEMLQADTGGDADVTEVAAGLLGPFDEGDGAVDRRARGAGEDCAPW